MNIGIIPCRYGSTRFPGKPLALIHGKPMFQWVFEAAMKSDLDKVIIATDDERIFNAAKAVGCGVVMTGECSSGTERVWEVISGNVCSPDDTIINIQGDEPLIKPETINQVLNVKNITTLKHEITEEEAQDPDTVKVVGNGLCFTRQPVPHKGPWWGQVGIYSFPYRKLKEISTLPKSDLEVSEDLEQLRWLDAGHKIDAIETEYKGVSVDRPEDIERVEKYLTAKSFLQIEMEKGPVYGHFV